MRKVLSLLVLLVASGAQAATFNQFSPATGILKGSATTPVTTAATSSDVIATWSGVCSSSTYLRGDGTCAAVVTSGAALTKADDTNVTLTLGGSPTTALVNASSLTLGWTGTLAASRGGLGMSTVTDDTLPVANGSIWQSKAVPDCDTATSVLQYDTATNAFSCATNASPAGAALTRVDDTNVTLTLGGSPTTALVNAASITAGWTGQLSAARGGTGLATVTDDTTLIANGTTWQSKALTDCNATNEAVTYDTATNAWGCATITGVTFANPSASIGLTANNGVATTAMRSDATPALSQSITPTWTGAHTWGTIAAQSSALVSARGRSNGFEFGHNNTSGFGSTLGYGSSNGQPFLAEHGTNANTFRTRGVIGNILTTNAAGALTIGRAVTASADNQSLTTDLTLAADGGLFMTGATGSSQGAGTINATGVYDDGTLLANQVGANPTGTIGLSAVNGSAGTFLRSDGAPALSQAIAPTWTSSHTFTATPVLSAASPSIRWSETDQAVDDKSWRILANGATFAFQTTDDAITAARSFLSATRGTGITTTNLSFGNATDNQTYTFAGTGAATFGGPARVPAGVVGTPALAFSADTDTGLYHVGADIIGASAGGAIRLQVRSGSNPVTVFANDTVGDGYLQFQDSSSADKGYLGFGNASDDVFAVMNQEAASLVLGTSGAIRATVGSGGGVTVGSPTGGNQGDGTINATGLYVNGVSVAGGATQTGTFNPTFTGYGTPPSCTMKWRLTGSQVSLFVNAGGSCTATSNNTGMSITNLPAAITPSANAAVVGVCTDQGTDYDCMAVFTSSNVATFYLNTGGTGYSATGFSAAGTKGVGSGVFLYDLRN
jgi:hypothetical protein